MGRTETETVDLPAGKAKTAVLVGNLLNDARVTNVLLVILALVGMGGLDLIQTQVCSV